jgi:hypothetical protein
MLRWWRWAALPLAGVYLILLATRLGSVITNVNLDADAVSAPVIGQLFGAAPAHASVVLGEFGWYSTLLFELATKWLPGHREIWVLAPLLMALAGAGLVAWSAWSVAGRFSASLSLTLLVCAAPATLRLELSLTQHAPDWFCCALLSAWLVLIVRYGALLRPLLLGLLTLAVGLIVGVNAASDPLLTVAGLIPFAAAVLIAGVVVRGSHSPRTLGAGLATLAFTGAFWGGTLALMSALGVSPEPGLHTSALAAPGKLVSNLGLWLHSVAVLGHGDFFGQDLRFATGLAVLCAGLSVGSLLLVPRLSFGLLRVSVVGGRDEAAASRAGFAVFWSASAVLLSAAFVVSATPVDIHADRYLVGVVYALAALIPMAAAARPPTRVIALVGTCLLALAGVISMAKGEPAQNASGFPSPQTAGAIARLAARQHARIGYAGYWDAAPVTWSTRFRVRVYPVSICDQGQHLCRFDLHYISSWYEPHGQTRSFLLADPSLALVPAPPPSLGRPAATYRVGQITMYVYPYDLAAQIRAEP